MTRHSRAPRDPTADNGLRLAAISDDLLGQFFADALTDREKVVVVAALYYLASPGYLPSYHLHRDEAERLEAVARSKLRAYGVLRGGSDDLAMYGALTDKELQPQDIWDDRAPVKSTLIQSLAEELREFRAHCRHCGQEMWRWRSRFGRSRSYCSNACRQAAYRARRAGPR
jgi:hypothetical protein